MSFTHTFLAPLMLLFVATARPCILNATHCTCAEMHPKGKCLSHNTSSEPETLCLVRPCYAGIACDCASDRLCTISKCHDSRKVYQPLEYSKIQIGQTIHCVISTNTRICLEPIPSPSPTPSQTHISGGTAAKPSSSAEPRAGQKSNSSIIAVGDVAVSTKPESSLSITSKNASASPQTQSQSPAPLKSDTPILLNLNAPCNSTQDCGRSLVCDCKGRCAKYVQMEVVVIADDSARMYICGEELGFSQGWDRISVVEYVGVCGDIVMETRNSLWRYTGMAIALQYEKDSWATGRGGLDAVVEENPASGYISDVNYDFSNWREAVIHKGLAKGKDNFPQGFGYDTMFELYGAEPVSFQEGSSGPNRYVYKISPPFCSDTSTGGGL